MSTKTVSLPPPRAKAAFVEKNGQLTIDAVRNLQPVYDGSVLQTINTSTGPATFGVPLAAKNQGKEIVYVKISSDASLPTLAATGSDKINGASTKAMGTAQYSKIRLKSDGQSPGNWYIVG